MKRKYPISKEYFPFNKFTAPSNRFVIALARLFLKPPLFFLHNKKVLCDVIKIKGFTNENFKIYVLTPKELINEKDVPAIIFIHGGGFIYDASSSHYKLALKYALECHCKVIYVRYNLAPKYPFPYPQEEGYCALSYVYNHSEELGIDKTRIGITGDSAGATISVTSMLLARERNKDYRPLFQVLIYPWLDKRKNSESNKKYTDTPMWNSSLSRKTRRYTNPQDIEFPPYINSPVEYEDLSFLPQAYIEVAEFDCLHDDGVLFHQLLLDHGISSELHEVKNAMHGFDTVFKAKTTQKMVQNRIIFIKNAFKKG